MHVALDLLIMMSLAKQSMGSRILSIMKLETTWHRRVIYKLLKSLTSMPMWQESIHRNHVGIIDHCDITNASCQLMYQWCHNSSTTVFYFVIIGSGDGTNVDLHQLNDKNHINDQCTKHMEPEKFGKYYERSARHHSFREDSRYCL